MQDLIRLDKMISELQEEPSRMMKEEILRKYPDLQKVLKLIYDPLLQFNVTRLSLEYETSNETEIRWEGSLTEKGFEQFLLSFKLNPLNHGDVLLARCSAVLSLYPTYSETIIRALDKDLRCGISVKTINSVFPNLIPEFNVPLAKNYSDGMCDFEREKWFLSRKLDGIRCLAFFNGKDIRFFSRKGKEFHTLGKVREELTEVCKEIFFTKDTIFDGEICIINKDGNENFTDVMKVIRRKDFTIPNPKFFIFDVYPVDEFLNKKKTTLDYSERMGPGLSMLRNMFYSEILHQSIVKGNENLATIPEGYEGFILRKDGPTEFKRSNSLLKVKEFHECEYTVISTEDGYKMISGVETSVCSAINVRHKGNLVSVGSGITDEQRISWRKEPSKIEGKKVTIKYFSESVDKNQKISLRFPTLKTVWEGEKE